MIYIDEVPKMKLLNKKFYLPLDIKNKKFNNSVLLLSPNYDSTVRLLNNPLIINKHYESYYIEKDSMYVINHEGYIDIEKTDNLINETKVNRCKSEDGKEYKCTRAKPTKLSTTKDIDKVLDKTSVEDINESIFIKSISISYNRYIDLFEILYGIVYSKNYQLNEVQKKVKEKIDNKYLQEVKSLFNKYKYHKFAYIAHILTFGREKELSEYMYDTYTKAGVFKIENLMDTLNKGMYLIEDLPIDKFSNINIRKAKKDIRELEEFLHIRVKQNITIIENKYSLETKDAYCIQIGNDFYSVQGKDITDSSIHELMHVYINPIVSKNIEYLDVYKKYYDIDKRRPFIKNGYALFETYMCESLVRCTHTVMALINQNQDVAIITDLNKVLGIDYIKDFSVAKELIPVIYKYYKQDKLNFEIYMTLYFKAVKRISELEEVYVGYTSEDKVYGEEKSYIKYNNGDNTNLLYILEDTKYNKQMRKLLYRDRLKTNKDVFEIYEMIKEDIPYIKHTYLDYSKYKNRNLIIDTFFYNSIFLNNNVWKKDKGIELYFDLINRFIDDSRLQTLGYNKLEVVLVPVLEWKNSEDYLDFNKDINILSMLIRLAKTNNRLLQYWKGKRFVFMTSKGYFVCDPSELNAKTFAKFSILLNKLINGDSIEDPNENIESKKAIMTNIIDKIEDTTKIQVYKATGDKTKDKSKEELADAIDKASSVSANTDDALDKLEEDERIKKILLDLAEEEEDNVKLSNARISRMMTAQDKSKDKIVNGKTIREILEKSKEEKEIPKTELHIDSINEEWKDLRYINFEEAYDIDEDILNILYSLNEKSDPIVILDVDVKDTSTSEDYKETYTVKMENSRGERFTIKFDIPKFIDHKFMRLRGNEKTINGQLAFIPILKTDEDEVQLITNYKKIFIQRYGSSAGKSYPTADIIHKSLKKYEGKDIKIVYGDNSIVCGKYDLPIDYIDLASIYDTIETDKYIIYFNQDIIRKNYKVDESKGLPIAYNKKDKRVEYWDSKECVYSDKIYFLLSENPKYYELCQETKFANKYMYSRAKIMNNYLPLIVLMAHSEGLEKTLKKANIRYTIQEKRAKNTINESFIRFKDAYLVYEVDYNSSLLMNGLKECNTEDYSITEMNNKSMYLDFLDSFGGRILSDGLDNFYDLMIDPITKEVLVRYNLPTDYCELLAYANFLLADNKYIKHTDMTARRYRSNELVAGYTYQAIAESYGAYRTEYKKRGKAAMSIKQSAIIDKVMLDPTCADLSMLNDVQNAESINALTYKGLAGLNHDRSYDLEKRGYDETMLNVVAMSTGFAGNVGITRQSTIDMNIEGKRGYIKTIDGDTDKLSITKTFGVTESMTPFGPTRDDPMRSAMNFIQTNKHGMRIKNATPMLISTGGDMALPYITSNVFSFNAKDDGKVVEITDDYMIVEYKNGTNDFIDLRNNVKKNSNGGFYQSIKLDTDLKVGNRFKKKDIIAYDKMSYSSIVGPTDDLAYSTWALCKIAMMNSDEGFEDSAIVSEWLSDALSSKVVIKKECILPKETNVYHIVNKGQAIQEGDPLLIFQNAFEDEDVNILLKNLGDDEEVISDLGRIPIKSKVTGVVEDIKIYRTVEKTELSDSLKKIVNKHEKPVNDIKKVMDKYDVYDPSKLEPTYVLEKSGKLKNVDDGILIEFYLAYDDKMSIGDKLIYNNGVKGVVKDVIPEGKEPYSDFRKDEKIHSIVPYFGVANRIVCSIFITMALNKVIIELDRKVKEMCDIPYKYFDGDTPNKK